MILVECDYPVLVICFFSSKRLLKDTAFQSFDLEFVLDEGYLIF